MENKITRKRKIAAILCLSAYCLLLIVLNKADSIKTAASRQIFVPAKVVRVMEDNLTEDTWTEGRKIGQQLIEVQILSGKYKGLKIQTINYVNAYTNVNVKKGTRLIVNLSDDSAGNVTIAYISGYDRIFLLLFLFAVFAGLLIGIGRKKGFMALAGLCFTVISIWYFLIPLLKRGVNPVIAAIMLVTAATFVTFLLQNGMSKKTVAASIGCIGGVVSAGILSFIAAKISPVNGYNMPEAETLVLAAKDSGLLISGLFISGILISSLGAIMDTAMKVTTSIFEVHAADMALKEKQLFKIGMSIGKDAIGTMVNTLILAFAGTSLNMLILFRTYDYPYLQIINSDMMILEIINGIAGSIGIILTVPIVAFISSYLCIKNPVKEEKRSYEKASSKKGNLSV